MYDRIGKTLFSWTEMPGYEYEQFLEGIIIIYLYSNIWNSVKRSKNSWQFIHAGFSVPNIFEYSFLKLFQYLLIPALIVQQTKSSGLRSIKEDMIIHNIRIKPEIIQNKLLSTTIIRLTRKNGCFHFSLPLMLNIW